MSKPLVITISHALGKDEALRRIKSGITRATETIPVLKVDEQTWTGDRMAFRVHALGQAASGTVDVMDDAVRLEVLLPWMLQKFADLIQSGAKARGRLLLEKK